MCWQQEGVRGAGGSVQAPSPKPRCPSGAKAPLIPSSPHESAPALRGRSRRSPHESVLVPAHLVSPCSPSCGPAPALQGRGYAWSCEVMRGACGGMRAACNVNVSLYNRQQIPKFPQKKTKKTCTVQTAVSYTHLTLPTKRIV